MPTASYAQADDPAVPPPDIAELQATIEAQAERINELEQDWEQVTEEQSLILDRAIFSYVVRPMALLAAVFIGFGIVLAWRSLNEIPQRLLAFEQKIDMALAENQREQQSRLRGIESQRDRMLNDIESRLMTRAGEIEKHYKFRLKENASKTLDIVEGTMMPIRMPRGHNLGDLYNTIQAGGYENITWYDSLGDKPFQGVTLVYIRSNDDASRLLTYVERQAEGLHPRESGFLLYTNNRPISPNILTQLMASHLNLSIAETASEITLQLLQLGHGLKRDIRSPGL